MPRTPSPSEHDTASHWSRIVWLDARIRDGVYPNVATLQEEFGIGRRMAFKTVEFLRDSLRAPITYVSQRRGYYYAPVPTHVGVNREAVEVAPSTLSCPHARGGEPQLRSLVP